MCTLAILVRTYHIEKTKIVPTSRHLVGDAIGYHDWSRMIAAGDWVGNEPFYQAPLYPYALAVISKVVGPDPHRMLYVQAFWGSLAVLLLYLATARLFDVKTACIAGVMLAFYPPAIFFDSIMQKTSLAGVLVCALVWFLSLRNSYISYARSISLGLVLGLLCLTRENAFAWWPFILVWLLVVARAEVGGRKQRYAHGRDALGHATHHGYANHHYLRVGVLVACFILGMMLVLGPVALRNRLVGGAWSLSTFQAGPNFYIGNSLNADGYYKPLVRGHETPQFERADATLLAERAKGRALSMREVSRYWMSRAWSEIGENPGRWLKIMGRKLLMVVNWYEVADVESLYVHAGVSPGLAVIGTVWQFGVLAPLAAMGVVLTRSRWRELWIYYVLMGVMIVAVAAFFVLARYRYAFVPLMIPFAAAGLMGVVRGVRAGRAKRLWGAGLAGVVVAGVCHLPLHDEARLNALAYMNAGVAAAKAGDLAEATPYLAYAVEVNPSSMEAQNNLAQALSLQGRYGEAVAEYEAALALEKGDSIEPQVRAEMEYNYGVALEHVGRVKESLAAFERALMLTPDDDVARTAVERLKIVLDDL